MLKQAGLEGKLSDLKVSDPQATAEPFTVGFGVEVPGFAKWSGSRIDLRWPLNGDVDAGAVPELDETGPITLPPAGQVSYTVKLDLPAGAKVRLPVAVSISRDYGDYRATYTQTGTTVVAERRLITRQGELPNSRRADFIAFLNVLNGDARQRLSVDSGVPATSDLAVAPVLQVKVLNQACYDALRNRDYARA